MAKQSVVFCQKDRQHHHIHNLPDGRRICGGCGQAIPQGGTR